MKKDLTAIALILFSVCVLTACQGSQKKKDLRDNKDISPQLTWEESMELTYATEFQVDRYEGGYALLTIFQDGQYLVVPEGKDPPRDLDKEITLYCSSPSKICIWWHRQSWICSCPWMPWTGSVFLVCRRIPGI